MSARPTSRRPADPRSSAEPVRATSLIRTTLTEQTYEILKERILDQVLAPGARLNIDALTRELGVSSSPLREALTRLEAERLVSSELYSGYTVAAEPSRQYLLDLIDFRLMLEGRSARVGAPRKDAAILSEMRTMVRQMAAIHKLGTRYKQYRRFVAADIRFHQAIVRSGGNAVVTQAYLDMNAILHQARIYLHRSGGEARAVEVAQEHGLILSAYEAGDGEAASHALSVHLDGGKRRLVEQAG